MLVVAVVKANYLRRGAAHRLGRGVAYYTWRKEGKEGEEVGKHPRTWHAADGRTLDYATARQEITSEAQEAAYTYRLVLSTAEAPLAPEAYRAVLEGQFEHWYLVTHHDGTHPHAHCVALSDRRLARGELGELREALAEAEAERVRACVRAQDADEDAVLVRTQVGGQTRECDPRERGEEMEPWR